MDTSRPRTPPAPVSAGPRRAPGPLVAAAEKLGKAAKVSRESKKILEEAQAFLAKRPKKLAITGCRFSPGLSDINHRPVSRRIIVRFYPAGRRRAKYGPEQDPLAPPLGSAQQHRARRKLPPKDLDAQP